MLRWRGIQSASFQLWNANFFNIYRKNGGIDVLIHSRPYEAYGTWDRAGVHEFVFVADRLAVSALRKLFSYIFVSTQISPLPSFYPTPFSPKTSFSK